jgi:hypothetical protein
MRHREIPTQAVAYDHVLSPLSGAASCNQQAGNVTKARNTAHEAGLTRGADGAGRSSHRVLKRKIARNGTTHP